MSRRKSRLPNIAVIDFETDPFLYDRIPEPFCVEFYTDTTTEVFWGDDCADQLCEYLENCEQEYLIYAHNGGKFDFHFLHDEISNPCLIIKSRIVQCKLFQHTLRDSFAILPVPLRDFEKMEFDYALMERPVRDKHKALILEYLHVDCLSLYKAVMAFTDRFGRQMTIGGTAMRELKRYHKFDNQGSDNDRAFRPFYFGGRVECWNGGILDGPWKLVDRNSMYPSVMVSHNHPINGCYDLERDLPSSFERPYFALITATNRNALPHRGDNGDLLFNQERGVFWACSHELEIALEHDLIEVEEVHKCLVACEWTKFDKFILEHAALKEEAKRAGDVLNYVFEKLLMNSGYGRAGINPENFEDWLIHRDFGNEGELELKGYSQQADYDSIELWAKKADVKESQFCDVAIAASITSAARSSLLSAIQLADNPVYCDTDSIICRDFHGELDKYSLGAWDIEKQADTVAIAGRKLYAMYSGDTLHKLSSKGGTLTLNDIQRICQGETVKYYNQAPTFSLKRETKFITRRFKSTFEPELEELDHYPDYEAT